jgi:hypothetical protein
MLFGAKIKENWHGTPLLYLHFALRCPRSTAVGQAREEVTDDCVFDWNEGAQARVRARALLQNVNEHVVYMLSARSKTNLFCPSMSNEKKHADCLVETH